MTHSCHLAGIGASCMMPGVPDLLCLPDMCTMLQACMDGTCKAGVPLKGVNTGHREGMLSACT